jgi:hypothetical protein
MRRALLLLPLLAGCTVAQVRVGAEGCPPGLQRAVVAEAFFGRNAAGREIVSDAAWSAFVDEVVTPAFPDGLSVRDAAGQWRGRDGRIERERSKTLLLVLPGGSAAEASARLAPVVGAYRARFQQESVMLTTREGCVGF